MMRVTETARFKRARQWPLASMAVWLLVLLQPSLAAEKSIEKKTKIHRLSTTKRAVYDAFAYVNRIPEQAEKGGTFENLLAETEQRTLFDVPMRCVTLAKLIKLKQTAGRPKDLSALAELQALLEERNKLSE